MAKKKSIYEKSSDAVRKTAKAYLSGSSNNNTMANQISNYQTRLKGAGIDPSQATDKRNWFEKLTNLPEDQNALFDALELINRPQQALFGAIEAAQEGEDILEGARSGFSGEEDYYGGDILRNMRVSDKPLFTGPLSGEDRSLADVLGLGLDIFADPVDIPAFALKPVSTAAKGLEAADDVLDATKYAYKFDPLTALTQKESKSLLEGAVGGIAKTTGKAVKGVGNAAINAADLNTVKKLATDNNLITKGTKVTKENMPGLIEDLGKIGVDVPLKSEAVSNIGQQFNRMFNYKKSLPDNLYSTVTQGDNAIDASTLLGRQLRKEVEESMQTYANKVGRNIDEVDADVLSYLTSNYKPESDLKYYIRTALKNDGKSDIIKADAETLAKIKRGVEDFVSKTPNVTDNAIRFVPVEGGARIVGNKKLLGTIYNDPKMISKLEDIKTVKNYKLEGDALKKANRVNNLYNTDAEFKKLVDNSKDVYKQFADFLDITSDGKINFRPITRENYTKFMTTEKGGDIINQLKGMGMDLSSYEEGIKRGSKSAFGEKAIANADQANIQAQEKIAKRLESVDESIAYNKQKEEFLESQYKKLAPKKLQKENKIQAAESIKVTKKEVKDIERSRLEKTIKENELKEAVKKTNFENNIKKFTKNEEDIKDLAQKYQKDIYDINDDITKDILKKSEKVADPSTTISLSKNYDKYANEIKKYEEIKTKLSQNNLTKKTYDSLVNKLKKSSDKIDSLKADIIMDTSKISGDVGESFIEEAGKIAKKQSAKLTGKQDKLTKANIRVKNAIDKRQKAEQAIKDMALDFEKHQDDLKLELQGIIRKHNNLDEVKNELDYIKTQLASDEKFKSLLQTAEGTQLYSTSFLQTFDGFVNTSANEAKSLKKYNDIFLESGLKNENVLKFFNPSDKVKLGSNMKLIDKQEFNSMVEYMDKYRDLLPDTSKKLLKDLKHQASMSSSIAVDKDLLAMMEVSPATSKDAGFLLKTWDNINNLFKKTSTISPGTQMRNAVGNTFNMYSSGVPSWEIPKLYARSVRMSKSDYILQLINKSAKGNLTAAEAADLKVIKQFIESGAMGKGKNIRDIGELLDKAATDKESAKGLKKAWDWIFEKSGNANEKVDNINRMALLSYASENPAYVRKLGAKNAIDAMHQVLFDPQNLSPFEKKYMKRLIPFYTFTKQNLMYQAKNIVNNTTKYNRLMKTFNKMYESLGEDNYRQYQKENFEIPLFKNDDDNVVGLKTNLPISDLGEYLESPLQRMVSSTSPLIKTPFEQAMGVDTFTGRDISDRNMLDAILATTGLNNLTSKQIGKLYDFDNNEFKDTEDVFTAANLFPSVFRETDPSKVSNQQQYEELQQYQEYVKALKNQGIDVPTIKELTSSTQSSIRNMKNYRKKRSR